MPEVESIIAIMVDGGVHLSQRFQHEEHLQWEHARRWIAFSGTVAEFAFVVIYETLRTASATPSSRLKPLFKALEDQLFEIYSHESHNYPMAIGRLPLASERQQVCNAFDEQEETLVTMDMVLGVIFPGRSHVYQTDWAAGFPAKLLGAPGVYVAMRLAAHLTGVVTPLSLVGRSAEELGIMEFGRAVSPLSTFVSNYVHRQV